MSAAAQGALVPAPAAIAAAGAGPLPAPPDASTRIAGIDALRGMALAGILQVNIQSFTWGAGEPLGYLATPRNSLDTLLCLLQTALLQGKFYPILAFLFGVGLALQTRKLRALHPFDAAAARAAYRRRLLVLFFMGLLHGLLLYCGDVLSAYAVCALVFVALAPPRLGALLRFNRWCWGLAAVSLLFPPLIGGGMDTADLPRQIPAAVAYGHAVYCEAGFLGQLGQRAVDDFWQQFGSIPVFWPEVLALLGLGVIAGRLGWLQHPQRHARLWRRALLLGLGVGLPFSLLSAAMTVQRLHDTPGLNGGWEDAFGGIGSLLAAAYVAMALRLFAQPRAGAPLRWLADAGRLSLTNYVGQSLIMGALLSGWGLGWGAGATRAQLALLGLAIFALQLALSHAWLRRFTQGPLEALWRRATYGRVPGGKAPR